MNEEAAPADVRSQDELPRCCRLKTRNPRYPGMGRKTNLKYREVSRIPEFLRLSSAKKPREPNKLLVLTMILVLD